MGFQELMDLLPETYSSQDRELVSRAYCLAEEVHRGQKRASGEPYIIHCLAVASILADMHLPAPVIAAGLLHDTVEDTELTLEDIQSDFGTEIAALVDAVTKLTQLPRVSGGVQRSNNGASGEQPVQAGDQPGLTNPAEETGQIVPTRRQDLVAETLSKTFLAMGENVSVVLIKLADRLHNMRTLNHVPEHKRRRIAQETLDIFAPLANRLGIWRINWELEDLSFRYLNPDTFKEISDHLALRSLQRENEIQEIKGTLLKRLSQAGVQVEIFTRSRHIYAIFKKMVNDDVPLDQVNDVRGVRIMVPDVPACYSALGVIHMHWRPIPGEFEDYIALPKDNYYQSLHTAVVYTDGKVLEVQIHTPEMHQNADYGIAAHWRYKEGSQEDEAYKRRILWLRTIVELRQDADNAGEFVDSLRSEGFQERVYVFTPKGDIIDLPNGSTPIDFAYQVHTDIGHRCRGAKVNGKVVPLDYVLVTGDKVEILVAKQGGPSFDWLNANLGYVKTQRARAKIRQWFKRQAYEQNLRQGKAMMDRELRHLGLAGMNLEGLARKLDFKNPDELYHAIGCGDLALNRIVTQLSLGTREELEFSHISGLGSEQECEAVSVVGLRGLLTCMARCCKPAPGDAIIAYMTRGRGATIHRQDCPNILRMQDRGRLVRVNWGGTKNTHPVPVWIKAFDRKGLLKDVSTLIADEGINVTDLKVDVHKNFAVFNLTLEVRDITELSRVLDRLENLPNVLQAQRLRPEG